MPGIPGLRAWWAGRPPAAGAAVRATGVLSVGLHMTGAETVSRVVPAMGCVAWAAPAADFAVRLIGERRRWVSEAASPGALTSVAAPPVLGTRISALGRQPLAEALPALAALLWPVLLVLVVRHWRPRMTGAVFLACVATEGLAVLAATLAAAERTAWLAHTALVLFRLGLVLSGLAPAHFDARQVLQGAGDHWIAGGALAISAPAGADLIVAGDAGTDLWDNGDRSVLRNLTVVLLVLDLVGYVVLPAAQAVRPRPGCHVLRWATVFPMGMTAVAAPAVATALGVPWLNRRERVLLWAVVLWLAVAAGAVLAARADGGDG
ncbi:SLAC1 family transporter [Streptomyces puniciscabiei]